MQKDVRICYIKTILIIITAKIYITNGHPFPEIEVSTILNKNSISDNNGQTAVRPVEDLDLQNSKGELNQLPRTENVGDKLPTEVGGSRFEQPANNWKQSDVLLKSQERGSSSDLQIENDGGKAEQVVAHYSFQNELSQQGRQQLTDSEMGNGKQNLEPIVTENDKALPQTTSSSFEERKLIIHEENKGQTEQHPESTQEHNAPSNLEDPVGQKSIEEPKLIVPEESKGQTEQHADSTKDHISLSNLADLEGGPNLLGAVNTLHWDKLKHDQQTQNVNDIENQNRSDREQKEIDNNSFPNKAQQSSLTSEGEESIQTPNLIDSEANNGQSDKHPDKHPGSRQDQFALSSLADLEGGPNVLGAVNTLHWDKLKHDQQTRNANDIGNQNRGESEQEDIYYNSLPNEAHQSPLNSKGDKSVQTLTLINSEGNDGHTGLYPDSTQDHNSLSKLVELEEGPKLLEAINGLHWEKLKHQQQTQNANYNGNQNRGESEQEDIYYNSLSNKAQQSPLNSEGGKSVQTPNLINFEGNNGDTGLYPDSTQDHNSLSKLVELEEGPKLLKAINGLYWDKLKHQQQTQNVNAFQNQNGGGAGNHLQNEDNTAAKPTVGLAELKRVFQENEHYPMRNTVPESSHTPEGGNTPVRNNLHTNQHPDSSQNLNSPSNGVDLKGGPKSHWDKVKHQQQNQNSNDLKNQNDRGTVKGDGVYLLQIQSSPKANLHGKSAETLKQTAGKERPNNDKTERYTKEIGKDDKYVGRIPEDTSKFPDSSAVHREDDHYHKHNILSPPLQNQNVNTEEEHDYHYPSHNRLPLSPQSNLPGKHTEITNQNAEKERQNSDKFLPNNVDTRLDTNLFRKDDYVSKLPNLSSVYDGNDRNPIHNVFPLSTPRRRPTLATQSSDFQTGQQSSRHPEPIVTGQQSKQSTEHIVTGNYKSNNALQKYYSTVDQNTASAATAATDKFSPTSDNDEHLLKLPQVEAQNPNKYVVIDKVTSPQTIDNNERVQYGGNKMNNEMYKQENPYNRVKDDYRKPAVTNYLLNGADITPKFTLDLIKNNDLAAYVNSEQRHKSLNENNEGSINNYKPNGNVQDEGDDVHEHETYKRELVDGNNEQSAYEKYGNTQEWDEEENVEGHSPNEESANRYRSDENNNQDCEDEEDKLGGERGENENNEQSPSRYESDVNNQDCDEEENVEGHGLNEESANRYRSDGNNNQDFEDEEDKPGGERGENENNEQSPSRYESNVNNQDCDEEESENKETNAQRDSSLDFSENENKEQSVSNNNQSGGNSQDCDDEEIENQETSLQRDQQLYFSNNMNKAKSVINYESNGNSEDCDVDTYERMTSKTEYDQDPLPEDWKGQESEDKYELSSWSVNRQGETFSGDHIGNTEEQQENENKEEILLGQGGQTTNKNEKFEPNSIHQPSFENLDKPKYELNENPETVDRESDDNVFSQVQTSRKDQQVNDENVIQKNPTSDNNKIEGQTETNNNKDVSSDYKKVDIVTDASENAKTKQDKNIDEKENGRAVELNTEDATMEQLEGNDGEKTDSVKISIIDLQRPDSTQNRNEIDEPKAGFIQQGLDFINQNIVKPVKGFIG